MTEIYEHRRLPSRLAVTCPECGFEAWFDSKHGTSVPELVAAGGAREPELSWRGTLTCPPCGARRAHDLDWPADAFYRIEHRGEALWAYDRAMMEDILRYVAEGPRRDAARKASDRFVKLLLIPAVFLSAKARGAVTRKISALLERSARR